MPHYTGWRHFLQAAVAARQRGGDKYGAPCRLLQPGLAVTAPAIFFFEDHSTFVQQFKKKMAH
ncbi:hypothetical protein [Herbaspirillum sp. NPDC101396]|uniref:hypothetical protein n=1 Tax=Herbaspirillum sp. NPDC101396 TaxID=3364005 RepID=UPI00383A9B09